LSTFWADVLGTVRLIVTAGVSCGAIVIGVGSRLSMLLLRVTTGQAVHGVQSDDDFRIGQVTLAGTYSLVGLGAIVGVIGAATYLLVRTWLIGPLWLRRTTTGAASAVVAGAMLVHDDGIDFHLLTPTWLAIGLFVALPGLFGVAISATVDRLDRPVDVRTWRFWWPPLLAVACFPPLLFAVPFVLAAVVVVTVASRSGAWRQLRAQWGVRLVVRSGWMGMALLGLLALVNDIVAIT
jgi:hypothetical protein